MDYEQAKYYETYYKNKVDNEKSRISSEKESIRGYNSQKTNLEKRKRDVEKVIQKIEELDTAVFNRANRAAQRTDEAYQKAIHRSDVKSESFQTHFRTTDVYSDPNTNAAVQYCRREINRIDSAINNIDSAIRKAENGIAAAQSSIKGYNAQVDYYSTEKRKALMGL